MTLGSHTINNQAFFQALQSYSWDQIFDPISFGTIDDQIMMRIHAEVMGDWKWKYLEQVNYTHAMLTYDPELQMMHQAIDENLHCVCL